MTVGGTAGGVPATARCEILAIGTEMLAGDRQDTNSVWLRRELRDLAVRVVRVTQVGDDLADLEAAVSESVSRAELVVTTGGLGPTVDDITTRAAAEALRRKLVLNKAALKAMEDRFQKLGRPMSPHNIKQAYLPSGATIIPNPIGTACGFTSAKSNTLFFFLPGVPREMRRMLEETVLPLIKKEHLSKYRAA